jgi:hypothetical protein
MEDVLTNYGGVVVNLEPMGQGQESVMDVATYDQAFLGEPFSEARGKGRARRQARKLDRTAKKKERKLAKVQAKSDVKDARGQARIGRRADRKTSRQEMRNAQQEQRQGRRDTRVVKRTDRRLFKQQAGQDRRDMRLERRQARRPEEAVDQYEETYNETQEEDYYAPQDQYQDQMEDSYAPQDQGYYEEDSYGDQSYPSDDYATEDDQSGVYDESLPSEEYYGEEYYGEYFPDGEGDGYYEEDYYQDAPDYSTEDEYFFDDSSNFAGEAVEKKAIVPKNVQEICNKIEWNNELISRLKKAKDAQASKGGDTQKFDNEISRRFDRVQKFEQALSGYSSANGENNPKNAEAVKIAKGRARRARLMIGQKDVPAGILAKLTAKGMSPEQAKEWWLKNRGNHEVIKPVARPSVQTVSKFEGEDGNIAPIELNVFSEPVYDYDQPEPIVANIDDEFESAKVETEPVSGFGGSGSSNFGRNLLIGLAVGAIVVYAVKKYKLLK